MLLQPSTQHVSFWYGNILLAHVWEKPLALNNKNYNKNNNKKSTTLHIYILIKVLLISVYWLWTGGSLLLFVSAVHFAPYLIGLSSMMLIWAAEARCKWRAHLHNRMLWQRLEPQRLSLWASTLPPSYAATLQLFNYQLCRISTNNNNNITDLSQKFQPTLICEC